MNRRQDGFTLIEILVAISVLSVLSLGAYQLLFAGQRSSNATRDVVTISEEARLGLNRMLRDTREASSIDNATATSYTVILDFDNDQVAGENPNEAGDYEKVTFSIAGDEIRISAALATTTITEVLIDGVECVDTGSGCAAVFEYTSSLLTYDSNGDGETSMAELEVARAAGATTISSDLDDEIDGIDYDFRVASGNSVSDFHTQVTLRNMR